MADNRRQEEDDTPKRGDLEENDAYRRKPEGSKESGDTKLTKIDPIVLYLTTQVKLLLNKWTGSSIEALIFASCHLN